MVTLEEPMVAPGHTVQFYRDERFLIDSITTFIKGGLDLNETVLVIVTAQHRKELYTTLTSKELRNGKLWFLDSHEAFMLFMEKDWPNESQFMNGMERFLRGACKNDQIRVFGELVAVLCAEGKAAAALRLEELWNALSIRHHFPLLCAYSLSAPADQETRTRVCQLHQDVQFQ